jgi:hypothetical protein
VNLLGGSVVVVVVVVVTTVDVFLVVKIFGHGGVGYIGGLVGIIGVGGYCVTRLLPDVVGHLLGSGLLLVGLVGGRWGVLSGGGGGGLVRMGGSVYTGV